MDSLTISQVAQRGGVNIQTIRYYERHGLLAPVPRTDAGYRMFSSESVRRLRFIKRAQELGFSLKEIKDLLSLRMAEDCSGCGSLKDCPILESLDKEELS